jgi:hypothetical protein
MTALRAGLSWLYRMSDRLVGGVFALGVLTAPFYRVDYLRAHLLGTATTPATAGLAVLALGVGLAWRSLLRRDFVWADPAELTWADLTDRRVGTIGRRLWAGWAVRFAVAGYLAAIGALLLGTSSWLAGGCALFAAGALLAVVLGRRGPGRIGTWLERLVPLGASVLAGFAAVSTVPPVALWVLAGVAVGAAVVCAVGSGPVRAPGVASTAGRADLVRGYLHRVVRQVSVSFGDALALLPTPGPVPWPRLLAGRGVVVRFVVAGVAARARSLVPAVLLAVVVAVLHQVFPVLNPVWLVGLGVYFAGVPFASSLARLCAVPGLRRWLGCSDIALRLASAGAVAVCAAVWVGLVAVCAVPMTAAAWLAALLAVGAVVRTASRPALDYGNIGVAATPDGNLIPVGLLLQLAHGPELLVVGLLVIGAGLSVLAAAPVAAALAAYGVTR